MKRFQFIAYGTVLWALLIASVQAQEEAVPDNDPDTPAETDGGALSLQELQSFADVFQQIRAGYVEEVADGTLFEYAVRGVEWSPLCLPDQGGLQRPANHYRGRVLRTGHRNRAPGQLHRDHSAHRRVTGGGGRPAGRGRDPET